MSNKKVNEINDETLIKCMKDYLDNPVRYHPEYLQLLLSDYERRVINKMEAPAPHRWPLCTNFKQMDTSGI
jgi:hypothetical protein